MTSKNAEQNVSLLHHISTGHITFASICQLDVATYILYTYEFAGVIIRPIQTMHCYKGNPSELAIDLHCLIPPEGGNLMTSVS